jgi:hypothetical protein
MPHSAVTKIELKGNNIELTVKVDGFDVDEPIEISGHASQTNGAIATFYTLQSFSPGPDGDFFVTVTSVPSMHFMTGDVITVVGRAAKIWSTVLDGEPVWKARPKPPSHP